MSKTIKSIVVVEDDHALQEAIRLKLSKEKYKVTAFYDGNEAIAHIKKEVPALVWLDLMLPGIDGIEVLRQIRQELNLPQLPVVLVSVSAGPDKISEAKALGANGYIVKSNYNLKEIIGKVEMLLQEIEVAGASKVFVG